ncbi:alpha/beta fold hydrolase [Catenulispora sp. NF23]|uniref:alpha/beta hydrolase n=1 Tax=Catenulispora pinistramenti TaxID=2705254 RepID=UPI001BA7C95A|nr:alpha/beta hydrolase [Catenulispora pinistramenti]MBS2535137.1 alpha/beta fold hydrolase [Catenulispora pinistramenti]
MAGMAGTADTADTADTAHTVPGGYQVAPAAWQPCQDGMQCATVQVPLDYRHPRGEKISIAMMRHQATDAAHRRGTLFFNSGGPYEQLLNFPRYLPALPAVWLAQYDIVNFDPRGFGYSTSVRCFPSEAAEAGFLAGLPADVPVTPAQISTWDQTMAAFSAQCAKTNGSLLQHTSTADVARDMDLLRQAVGAPMLNYVAGSYGTGLGAVYANLFPGKVGRMILDGNVDPVAWTRSDGGTVPPFVAMRADVASARTLDGLLDTCGATSTAKCAFSAGTPAATKAKYDTLISLLHAHPVTIGSPPNAQTCDDVCATYSIPLAQVSQWTDGAAYLQQLWQAAHTGQAVAAPAVAATKASAGTDPTPPYVGGEQTFATICSDSDHPRDPRAYTTTARISQARAGLVGLSWTWTTEICATWPKSEDTYLGPWNRPTANPILIVGNTGDPNTPYWNSIAMTHDLARARLLTIDGFGHTELLNPSTCATDYETSYLQTGALPAQGTVCQQDAAPFA